MIEIITSRFKDLSNADYIRSKVEVCPPAVEGLESILPQVASEILVKSLKKIFVPTPFVVNFLQDIVGSAELYCKTKFGSQLNYIEGIYNPEERLKVETWEVEPFCLTGLAGVGKSEIINALSRLMPAPVDMSIDHFIGEQKIVPYWYVSGRGDPSGKQVLLALLNEEGSRKIKGELLLNCQRRAQRFAVSLVILDETQFTAKGDGAAKSADMLLTLAMIGPPMLLCRIIVCYISWC